MSENKDVQKLSKEELDNISGGADFKYDGTYVYIGDLKLTPAQFTNSIYTLADNGGLDVAIAYLHNLTGYTCQEMGLGSGSAVYARSDKERLGVIMSHFWGNYGEGREH